MRNAQEMFFRLGNSSGFIQFDWEEERKEIKKRKELLRKGAQRVRSDAQRNM